MTTTTVWVFVARRGDYPGGIFSSAVLAEAWIKTHSLSGLLTEYPLDQGAYDLAVETGAFTPKNDSDRSPSFIASFAGGRQEHMHFENGRRVG